MRHAMTHKPFPRALDAPPGEAVVLGIDPGTAVTGFGLAALVSGVQEGWLDKETARARTLKTLRTFALLHTAYAVFTLINLVLGVLVTLWIQKSDPIQEE